MQNSVLHRLRREHGVRAPHSTTPSFLSLSVTASLPLPLPHHSFLPVSLCLCLAHMPGARRHLGPPWPPHVASSGGEWKQQGAALHLLPIPGATQSPRQPSPRGPGVAGFAGQGGPGLAWEVSLPTLLPPSPARASSDPRVPGTARGRPLPHGCAEDSRWLLSFDTRERRLGAPGRGQVSREPSGSSWKGRGCGRAHPSSLRPGHAGAA